MDIKQAARNTLTLWEKNHPEAWPIIERAEDGVGLAHQRWVLEQIVSGEIAGEKGHRWLGWAQGYLAALGYISLDDAKYANVLS